MADNLLDKASILLTPTAYNDGRMLSVKPNENLYGSELVTNGDFSNGSANWTLGTGMSIINEELHITNNSTNDRVYQNIGLVQGKIYQVSFDVLSFSGTSFQILMGGTSTPDIGVINSTGSYTFTQECLGSNGFFYFMSTLSNVVIDNVSVVEDLSGDFQFSRSSAATRVNAQGLVENVQIISPELVSNGDFSQIGTEEVLNGNFSQEGSELIVNGDFSDSSWWGLDASWTISGGSANCNGSGVMYKGGVLTIGKTYKVEVEVSAYTSGSLNYPNASNYSIPTSIGKHTFYYTAASQTVSFTGNSFIGSIDNVSVKEVGQNWDLGTGWSIGDGVAISDGTVNQGILQENILTVGKIYKITFDVDVTSGTLSSRIRFKNDFSATTIANITASGSYTFYQEADRTGLQYIMLSDNTATSSITNISVKEVGQDWTFFGEAEFTDDGARIYSSSGGQSYINQSILTSTKKYRLSYEITDSTTGSLKLINVNGLSDYPIPSTVGTHTLDFIANNNTFFIYRNSGATDVTIDNISVKEITDDTDLPRINYSGFSYQDSLGSEQVVNGTFDNGSTGWNVAGGNPIFENSSVNFVNFSTINSNNTVVELGNTYKITYTISNKVGNSSFQFFLGGWNVAQYQDVGTHSEIIIVSSSSVIYIRNGDSNSSVTIDNVSVKEYLGQEVVPDSGCGNWLLEPQSTNLVTYSEDFSQWRTLGISGSTTVTYVSDLVNPDGSIGGYKVSGEGVYLNLSLVAGTEKNIYARTVSGTGTAQLLSHSSNTNNTFNLTEDWQRFDLNYTSNIPTSFYVDLRGASTTLTELYVWGANATNDQDYPTSYIPTNGATNTRLQDIANNSGNSTLINSTEGVLYAEISALADDGTLRQISLSDGSYNNTMMLRYLDLTNNIQGVFRVGGVFKGICTFTLPDSVDFIKVAYKYKNSDFALWVNGAEVATSTDSFSISAETLTKLSFDRGDGTNKFNGKAQALAIYKEALTDAELQSLTTI